MKLPAATIALVAALGCFFSSVHTVNGNKLRVVGGAATTRTAPARATPTPFPILTPAPTATPAVAPPNNNPYLDAAFRGPRLVSPSTPARVRLLSGGKFVTFFNVEALVNRDAGCVARYNSDGSYDPSFQLTAAEDVLDVAETGNQLLVAAVPNVNSPAFQPPAMQVLRVNDDGSIDPTFASNAIADSVIYWLTVQPDGNILVAGEFSQFAGAPHKYIVRLLPSGQVDSSFTSPSFAGAGFAAGNRPVVQPDGRILIVGNFTAVGGQTRPRVARLNANGTLDTSFVPSGFTNVSAVRGLVLLPNGQIVISGRFTVPASFPGNTTGAPFNYLPLLRLNTGGSADGSFGIFDESLFGTNSNFSSARDVKVQSDGKLIAYATRSTLLLNTDSSILFRFNADGSLDSSFHQAAVRAFVPGTSDFYTGAPGAYLLESSGTMLLAGTFNSIDNDGIVRYGAARFMADGTPAAFAPELCGFYDYPLHAVRFGDRRMWIGCVPNSFEFGFYNTFPHNLARVNADGTFDFSLDLASSVGDPRFLFGGVTGLPGDKAFVWGANEDNGTPDYFRLLANGMVDSGFTFDSSAPRFAEATALAGGELLLSAGSDAQSTVYATLSRLQADGTHDSAFQFPGSINVSQVIRDVNGRLNAIYAGSYPLAVQSDGKVLFEYLASDDLLHLIRLNADGSVDGGFSATAFSVGLTRSFPSVYDPVTGQTLQPQGGLTSVANPIPSAQVLSDGSIVVVGHFTSFNGVAARGVIRLQPNGAIDNTFAIGGGAQWTTITETATHFPAVEGVNVLANDDLLIVGDFQAFNGAAAPGIARLHSDGSVVANFSSPVQRIYEHSATARLFPQPDGSLMLSGPYSFAGETIPRSLVRLFFDRPLLFTTAVSRKTHGAAGDFDVSLPGVECRTGGTGGDHTLVVTFSNTVVSGNAAVTNGTGNVTGTPAFSGNTMTINLTGVTNAQAVTVTLSNVTDSFSQRLPDTAVSAGFLLGDTNGNGVVNASDVSQTKAQLGQSATGSNFRTDVNASGAVNATDVSQIKAKLGTALP